MPPQTLLGFRVCGLFGRSFSESNENDVQVHFFNLVISIVHLVIPKPGSETNLWCGGSGLSTIPTPRLVVKRQIDSSMIAVLC